MDIVYNPLETRLLREAKTAGCRTIRGLEMFLNQAVAQFELWTQQPAPADAMRTVLESRFS
jgi:shikimate dehydrogenase